MPRPPRLLPLVLCTLWAAPASAFEFDFPWIDEPSSFQIVFSSIFEHHDDNFNKYSDDDGFQDLKNRLNLKLNVERFSVSARIDSTTFFDPPLPSRNEYNPHYIDRYAPEKITVDYRGRNLKVTLGDFYATIGHGLALSVRKTDQVGEDNTLLGAKVRWRSDSFEVTALSGLSNPSNLNLFEKTYPDPYDLISAASGRVDLGEGVSLGIHGVGMLFDPFAQNENKEQGTIPDHTVIAGTRIEALGIAELLDLYFEANWLGRKQTADQALQNGWGIYASASMVLGDFSVTAEGKSLKSFYAFTQTWEANGKYAQQQQVDYILPPTLEAVTMEVGNNHDLSGGRLQLDYRPGGGSTLVFATYSGFWAQDLRAGDRWIYNLAAGAEQDFLRTGRARITVGLREEAPQYEAGATYHLLYADATLKAPVSTHHSLELHSTNWFQREGYGDIHQNFARGDTSLGWAWSPWLAASVIFGYDTSPSRRDGGYDFSTFHRPEPGAPVERQLFLAGSLSVNLWGDYILRLTGGQMRGGLLCINGICRRLPPFAGVRAELTLRF